MNRTRIKTIAGRSLRFCWNAIAVGSLILGLGGAPDDYNQWTRWIDSAMNDPLVQQFAATAVEIADFINQYWVRALLVIIGAAILGWGWRPFWRIRHRLSFRWRSALADQVWIPKDQAIKVIKESHWGRLREPNVVRSINIFESISMSFSRERVVYGLSDTQKALLKYDLFLEKTLDKFCEVNPKACRHTNSTHEIDEVSLKVFLRKAIDDEIGSEFGELPDYKVT